MRTLVSLLVLGLAMLLWSGAQAGEKKEAKEVTLKGSITCAKCDLNVEKSCATVIVVKKDKESLVYYFDKDGDKKFHEDICTAAKKGTVVGTVSKEGKKLIVKVSEVKYD